MSIIIQRAAISDAELIADISRETFYDTFASFNTPANMDKFMSQQFTRELLMREVQEQQGYFFIAYENDNPSGYVRLRDGGSYEVFHGKSSLEIARIYVRQSIIGKGLGSTLMRYCIDEAARMNREVIWLGVWEKNERAIRFYQRWGFIKFGEHDFWLGDDRQTDWMMMREVV